MTNTVGTAADMPGTCQMYPTMLDHKSGIVAHTQHYQHTPRKRMVRHDHNNSRRKGGMATCVGRRRIRSLGETASL
jgi:hypothetical protein